MSSPNELLGEKGYQGPYIGIEIEVEGSRLPVDVKGWRCERDGSLRGESMEYVLPVPLLIADAEMALKQLNLVFLRMKSEVEDTGYAGIHIHVNVGDMNVMQLVRYALAYYTIEELALRWCGEDRVGNLFCLGLKAAGHPLRVFKDAVEQAQLRALHSDDIRYAALNFKALSEYGSFEFRSMRSTLDRATILKWAKMLLELRAFALEDRPLDWFMVNVSQRGRDVLKTMLPTCYDMFFEMDGVEEILRDSVRHTQLFVASFDEERAKDNWEKRAKVAGGKAAPEVPKPFREGRVAQEIVFDEAGAGLVPPRNPMWRAEVRNEPEEDI